MKIIVLPGDGIGAETVSVAVDALELVSQRYQLDLNLQHDIAGHASLKKYGTTIHEGLMESVKKAKLPEDEAKRVEKDIQAATDAAIKSIGEHLAHKEKDLLTV